MYNKVHVYTEELCVISCFVMCTFTSLPSQSIVCNKDSVAKSVHLWEMFLNKNASS